MEHWREEIGRAKFIFWYCSIDGHNSREGMVTVKWVGDVAHCTFPGCTNTNVRKTFDEDLRVDVYRNGADGAPDVRVTHIPTGVVGTSDGTCSVQLNTRAAIQQIEDKLSERK